jgi:hypothetical protein
MQALERILTFDRLTLCAMNEPETRNCVHGRRIIFSCWIHGGEGDIRAKYCRSIFVMVCDDAASYWKP